MVIFLSHLFVFLCRHPVGNTVNVSDDTKEGSSKSTSIGIFPLFLVLFYSNSNFAKRGEKSFGIISLLVRLELNCQSLVYRVIFVFWNREESFCWKPSITSASLSSFKRGTVVETVVRATTTQEYRYEINIHFWCGVSFSISDYLCIHSSSLFSSPCLHISMIVRMCSPHREFDSKCRGGFRSLLPIHHLGYFRFLFSTSPIDSSWVVLTWIWFVVVFVLRSDSFSRLDSNFVLFVLSSFLSSVFW